MRPEEFTNLTKEKFVLVNENKKLRDKELVTKPVGFFRDAMNRFARNKGSIVGAVVIGLLVLFALIVPLFSQYTVSYNDTYYKFTLPKWSKSETTDFLDGCTKKTLNTNSFLYYYSMGVETGHNAVKRQEYTSAGSNMYTFRLDTYQQHGTVFMTLTKSDYENLQKYQDEHNAQVIYPITDPDLRPSQTQDRNNGSYWYKTESDGTITKPVDYKINPDGTIEFPNIYQPYSIPAMDSSTNVDTRASVSLAINGSGYSIHVNEMVDSVDESGNPIKVPSSIGFIRTYSKGNDNYTEIVDALQDASIFTYNTTLNTLMTNITGHANTGLDGNYFFALPLTTGTTTTLIKEEFADPTAYIPFNFYNIETGELVTSPVASEGQYYNYAVNRVSYQDVNYYINTDVTGFAATLSQSSAKAITIEETSGGYFIKIKQIGGNYRYLALSVSGGVVSYSINVNDPADATVFQFSDSRLHANLEGKDYFFAVDTTPERAAFKFLTAAEIDANSKILYFNLVDSSTYAVVTSLVDGGEYKFSIPYTKTIDKLFYLNGGFKGDNYTSKMRIEGEGVLTYSYAIPKAGRRYEVRVNYYEYFRYYHQAVLHDRISEPFFLFGTTSAGQDIFTCLASGARFSFILAIVVAAVNMIVGAIYGAIEGYYGGKVDLIMERIVEILSAVPFMIVITLLKYHMGGSSQVLILFIAFFLTGWIGESGTVRMQFYRFKNQEYVLAARTLGAKDWRIMFKHIFPNSLGTIVTSSVLVIPGMIFSETSLSYLGIINLNSGTMTSVGTLLANAQPYIAVYPHMILFPSIFISLLMLCFNLFGNGLRDAFNPSLRGTED